MKRTIEDIEEDVKAAADRLDTLKTELAAARIAKADVGIEAGDIVTHNGARYEVTRVGAWDDTGVQLYGRKLKKNGEPSNRVTWIGIKRRAGAAA